MDILYRPNRSAQWLLCAIMLFVIQPSTLPAQTNQTNKLDEVKAATATTAEHFIQQGRQLEIDGHWADALSLYQQAIKSHPRNDKLIEKRTIARIHYDLERRYSDNSLSKH